MDGHAIGVGVGQGLNALWDAYRWMKGMESEQQERSAVDRRATAQMELQRILAELRDQTERYRSDNTLKGIDARTKGAEAVATIGANSRVTVSENNLAGRRHAADQGLAGRKVAAEAARAIGGDRASATRYAADQGLAGRRLGARTALVLGQQRDRTARENNRLDLYGNLFRPQTGANGGWLSQQQPERPTYNSFIDSLGLPKDAPQDDDEFDALTRDLLADPGDLDEGFEDPNTFAAGGVGNEQQDMAEAMRGLMEFQSLQAQGKFAEAEKLKQELIKRFGPRFGG